MLTTENDQGMSFRSEAKYGELSSEPDAEAGDAMSMFIDTILRYFYIIFGTRS